MCPACFAVAGLVAAFLRPWRRSRRAAREASAAAWRSSP